MWQATVRRVIAVVGLRHVVEVGRDEQVQLLVGVGVDHGSVSEGSREPGTDGAIGLGPPASLGPAAFVIADQRGHVNLFVSLVEIELTDAVIGVAEDNPELEFADVAFPKAENPAWPLGVPVRASGEPPRVWEVILVVVHGA
jgi:hypothetical protein